jgi:sigma-E factor negative regulatory protein RseA
MNEELDSQLSAMFDDELPAAECELLARRLSRDEQLKARWGRYAVMGAAIRAERGVLLEPRIARRVSQALRAEPALTVQAVQPARVTAALSWWQPLASAAMAASVATAAILWMRYEGPAEMPALPAFGSVTPAALPATVRADNRSDSYVVPPASARRVVVPPTSFANYVVAHFPVSSPVAAQTLISALVAGTGNAQAGSDDQGPVEDVQEDAKTVEH